MLRFRSAARTSSAKRPRESLHNSSNPPSSLPPSHFPAETPPPNPKKPRRRYPKFPQPGESENSEDSQKKASSTLYSSSPSSSSETPIFPSEGGATALARRRTMAKKCSTKDEKKKSPKGLKKVGDLEVLRPPVVPSSPSTLSFLFPRPAEPVPSPDDSAVFDCVLQPDEASRAIAVIARGAPDCLMAAIFQEKFHGRSPLSIERRFARRACQKILDRLKENKGNSLESFFTALIKRQTAPPHAFWSINALVQHFLSFNPLLSLLRLSGTCRRLKDLSAVKNVWRHVIFSPSSPFSLSYCRPSALKFLQRLELHNIAPNHWSPKRIFLNLPALEDVTLSNMDRLVDEDLDYLFFCPQLRRVHLINNLLLTSAGAALISRLPSAPQLELLDLSKYRGLSHNFLPYLGNFPLLESLNVRGCRDIFVPSGTFAPRQNEIAPGLRKSQKNLERWKREWGHTKLALKLIDAAKAARDFSQRKEAGESPELLDDSVRDVLLSRFCGDLLLLDRFLGQCSSMTEESVEMMMLAVLPQNSIDFLPPFTPVDDFLHVYDWPFAFPNFPGELFDLFPLDDAYPTIDYGFFGDSLGWLSRLPQLLSLDVSFLGDFARFDTLFSYCPQLMKLKIVGARGLTDDVLQSMTKEMEKNSCLYFLDLQGNPQLTSDALRYFVRCPLRRTLLQLNLQFNPRIDDDGLFYLNQLECLHHLNLTGCPLIGGDHLSQHSWTAQIFYSSGLHNEGRPGVAKAENFNEAEYSLQFLKQYHEERLITQSVGSDRK